MLRIILGALLSSGLAAGAWLHLPAGGDPRPFVGEVEIRTGDALLYQPDKPTGSAPWVLSFETFTNTPPEWLSLQPLRSEGPTFRAIKLEPPGHSETWTPGRRLVEGLPENWRQLRLDFGLPQGRTLKLRQPDWRAPRPGEFGPAPGRKSSVPAEILAAEFERINPARIEEVTVGTDAVRIRGHAPAGPVRLAEIPMDRLLDDPERFERYLPVTPGDDGNFEVSLPRFRKRSGLVYDCLVSRWQLVASDSPTPLSHARYAEAVACREPTPAEFHLKGKKGLGGWHHGRLPDELQALGIRAVTVNIVVDSLLANGPAGEATIPCTWQGRTFHARRDVLQRFDATFREAARNDVMVSAILLVRNPARANGARSRIAHPAADPEGTYAMPDVVSEVGIAAYGGLLNLMAERWSHADGRFGRVHHWIVHNEVDAGWTWTNAGKLDALPFMDLYQRSMRLTDLIVRQYDPHARAFISLTHHWAEAGSPKYYGSRKMLDLLARFTAAEGDFPWALAHHPYPQDLRNPRTWEDSQVNFTFDTPKITPRNIEVLDAWMRRPEMLHHGKTRPVHLSENGFNSRDYSEKSFNDQAAGMAYAWKKIQALDSIKVWHYHNWIDNRSEGGLRIGLRRFPDDPEAPLAPKPIWHLYQALDTPREDATCAPYLKTIGISGWDEIRFRGPIR